MPERGEEAAGRIESHIRELIDKMVFEIRGSIQDVRLAVDSQLDAAVQSMQADVNALAFRPHLEQSLRDFEQELGGGEATLVTPPLQPVALPSTDVPRLKRAVQAIERGKSQVDVLNALLEQCLNFGSRAALLILKGDVFSGWKGIGFSAHGGSDEQVKRFSAAPNAIAEFDRLFRGEEVVSWDGASMAASLSVAAPKRAVLVPMVIKDKVAAAMYVDEIEGSNALDYRSVELLVFTTGLLIDTLAIRKKIPSPSLSLESASEASATEIPFTAAPAPVAAPRAAAPVSFAPPQPVPSIPPPSYGERVSAQPAVEFDDSATMLARPELIPAVPQAPQAAAPAAVEKPATELADRPSTQYIPPPGLARTGFGAPQTDESKKHDEAKRFARLLVSEIKLYNEAKVDQGRKNRDLYERMKDDIDRSRQMYDERIPEAVRMNSNYFYDELVRILADGDGDILGL